MRVVSENSEAGLARQQAIALVDWALRDLTANLLRITRGAGKPYEITGQVDALVKALIAYRDAIGHWPPADELANVLTAERDPEVMARMSNDNLAQIHAEQAIIRGSLQIVASRLLGQRTQESAGHHEMYEGLRRLEDNRAERRKQWAGTGTATTRKVKLATAKSRVRKSGGKEPTS